MYSTEDYNIRLCYTHISDKMTPPTRAAGRIRCMANENKLKKIGIQDSTEGSMRTSRHRTITGANDFSSRNFDFGKMIIRNISSDIFVRFCSVCFENSAAKWAVKSPFAISKNSNFALQLPDFRNDYTKHPFSVNKTIFIVTEIKISSLSIEPMPLPHSHTRGEK